MKIEKYRAAEVVYKIRERRLSFNYSQEYMALKMGISQNSYSKIEIGKSKLTINALFKIAEILETDTTAFID